jgi:hypothetical protein
MSRRILRSCLLSVALIAPAAYADFITSWGDGSQGTEYLISQVAGTIEILKGDGNVKQMNLTYGGGTSTVYVLWTISGTIDISGDVPEASGTRIRIKYLDDGHFECNDLGLLLSGVQGDDWLVVGHGLSDQQATMFGYSTELRSATQGKAGFSMEFARYERAPRDVQEEVIAKAREAKAAKR